MTILPGQPIAPPDAPPPSGPHKGPHKGPRGPRLSVSGRTLAAVVAGVVAVGGGGAWFFLHSSGGTTPVAAVHTTPVHHPAKPVKKTVAPPRTKAAAMLAATKIFAVMPAQLPGWQVDGKPAFQSPDSDPVSRSANRCLGSTGTGINVASPGVFHRTAAPTYMSVDADLGFMRTPAAAAADVAALRSAKAQKCLTAAIIGRPVAMGGDATMRFTSMRRLAVPRPAVAFEFDGQIDSSAIGKQAVRVVMLFASVRATEIQVTSAGLGAALPLTTDVRVLDTVVAQTRRLIG
jgi:hypothetical protein